MGEGVQRRPASDERAFTLERQITPEAVSSEPSLWSNRPRLLWLDWTPAAGDNRPSRFGASEGTRAAAE